MTPLRKHMIEDMQLRGLSARTQEVYLYAVRDLARYFRRSPDQLKDEDLRRYFLYLRTREKAVAVVNDHCALRDQIPIRNDTTAAVANAGVGESAKTIQAAGRAQP